MANDDLSTWIAYCENPSGQTFQPVFQRTKPLVYTVCMRILGNGEDCRDAFQATFARLVQAARIPEEEIPDARSFISMVGRFAHREAAKILTTRVRRVARESSCEDLDRFPDPNIPADEAIMTDEIKKGVEEAVSGLPEKYQLPVLLHYFHGISYRDIVEMTGIPLGTLSRRMAKALRLLKPKLLRAGIGESTTVLGALLALSALSQPPKSWGVETIYEQAITAEVGGAIGAEPIAAASGGGSAGTASALTSSAGLVATLAIGVALTAAYFTYSYFQPPTPVILPVQPAETVAASTIPPVDETGLDAQSASSTPVSEDAPAVQLIVEERVDVPVATEEFGVRVLWRDDRQPVNGALVSVMPMNNLSPDHIVQAVTDETGAATVKVPRDWQVGRLSLTHPDAESLGFDCPLAGDRAKTLLLSRGAVVYGNIVAEGVGAPVEGAEIVLASVEDGTEQRVLSNAAGEFEFRRLSRGNYGLAARHGSLRSNRDPSEQEAIRLSAGDQHGPHTLILREGTRLRGQVLESTTGSPLRGAIVKVLGANHPYAATTDEEGEYRISGLPTGRFLVEARGKNRRPERKIIALTEREEAKANFNLPQGGIVQIQVSDTNGLPLANAKVYTSGVLYEVNETVVTNNKGFAVIEGVDPLSSMAVWAEKEGYESCPSVKTDFNVGELSSFLELKLKPVATDQANGAYAGIVRDEAGNPVGGAQVRWQPSQVPYWRPVWKERRTSTGLDGQFLLIVPRTGKGPRYEIVASSPGFASNRIPVKQPGSIDTPADANLILKRNQILKGTVCDPDGSPIKNASIYISCLKDRFRRIQSIGKPDRAPDARSNSNGRFSLENLSGPTVDLTVYASGRTNIAKETFELGQEAAIVMRPKGCVKGRVLDAQTGASISEFSVRVFGDVGNYGEVKTWRWQPGEFVNSADGTFVVDDVNLGQEYRLSVSAPGYASTAGETVTALAPGERVEVEFRLSQETQVKCVVVDGISGAPIPGVAAIGGQFPEGKPYDWNWSVASFLDHWYQPVFKQMTTDQGGTLELPNESPELTLIFRCTGYARLVVRPEDRSLFQTEQGNLKIPLYPASSINGFYLPETGFEEGLIARLEIADRAESESPIYEDSPLDRYCSFGWDNLPHGDYDIILARIVERGRTAYLFSKRVSLGQGEHKNVHIQPAAGSVDISGQALLDGETLPDAGIVLWPEFQSELDKIYCYTNGRGQYQIQNLQPGRYKAIASPGGQEVSLELEIKNSDVIDFGFLRIPD